MITLNIFMFKEVLTAEYLTKEVLIKDLKYIKVLGKSKLRVFMNFETHKLKITYHI